ncbi:hypothetical protein AB4Z21_34145, partial [Paenibacillus sp. MCAF20]
MVNKIRNKTLYKECVHEDANCDGNIIRAHSIQNNKFLNRLSRNGNVLCIDFSKALLSDRLVLREVGRDKASTFTGFCKHHDNSIFKPIEEYDYIVGDIQQEYLFAYRAFALSYYERNSSYNLKIAKLDELKEKKLDTKDFQEECNKYYLHLLNLNKLRASMNINLDRESYQKIKTDVITWPYEYGIAATSMFYILFDNHGNTVNNLTGLNFSPIF